uniref:Phospholipid-transporting ATPase n=1 Tax=Strongyloides stercoralis TaxID=6248 RepID=A0A0K0DWS3_STRER
MIYSSSDSESSISSDDMGNKQCKNCNICKQLNMEQKSLNTQNDDSSDDRTLKLSEKTKKRIKNIDSIQNMLTYKMEDLIHEENFIGADIFKKNIEMLEEKKSTALNILQNIDMLITKLEFKKANDYMENYRELMNNCIKFGEIKEFLSKTEKHKINSLISEQL